jgi:hypothetical protein
VTIPSNATLTYWWYMATNETGYAQPDRFKVELYNLNGQLWLPMQYESSASTANTWMKGQANLAGYAGQQLELRFTATTDGVRPTSFFVDDVSLK